MKRRIFELSVGVALFIGVLAWWYWPHLRFGLAVNQLSVDSDGAPHLGTAPPEWLGANTFSDHLSSKAIGDLYDVACNRLKRLRDTSATRTGSFRTYHCRDLEGWDRVTSVAQFSGGFIYVTAANNDDNDSVHVGVRSGLFPPSDSSWRHVELKELPNAQLPGGTLRFQQPREWNERCDRFKIRSIQRFC